MSAAARLANELVVADAIRQGREKELTEASDFRGDLQIQSKLT